jgi:hypothetical protein
VPLSMFVCRAVMQSCPLDAARRLMNYEPDYRHIARNW